MNSTATSQVRPVRAVPGQVLRDATGTQAARRGSGVWLRLFEVTLALFLAGILLTDMYPWLSSFNRLLGGVLALLAIGSWLRRRGGIPAEVVLFGAFIAWAVVTGFLSSGNQSLVLAYSRLLSQELVLAFALAVYVRERGTPAFAFFLLMVVPLALFLYARGAGQFDVARQGGRGDSWRLTSFTDNPNTAASLCLYGLFAVGYFLWNRRKQGLVFWPLLVLPFTASSLIFSASRKNLVSVGVFVLMWVFLTYGRAKKSTLRLALLLLVVLASLFAAGRFVMESTPVGERFRQAVGGAQQGGGRLDLYMEGWAMFLESPIVGVGLGNYVVRSSTGHYAHSDYTEVLATTGLVGFMLYFSIYLVLWRRLQRVLKRRPDATTRYMVGLNQAAIIPLLVLGLGTPNFLNPLHLYVIGVLVGHAHAMEQDLRGTRTAESRAGKGATSVRPVPVRRVPWRSF